MFFLHIHIENFCPNDGYTTELGYTTRDPNDYFRRSLLFSLDLEKYDRKMLTKNSIKLASTTGEIEVEEEPDKDIGMEALYGFFCDQTQ